jgi:aspartate aminotransferase
MRLARCMERLGTETAFEVLARARALEAKGRDVVHLEIGEPDFGTPENIIDAAVAALHQGKTHYTPSAGIPELRATIAEEVARTRGIAVTPEEVVVTPGGKPIMFFALLALVEAGDEVIYPNPGFPIYESMIDFVGAKAVPLQLREGNGFCFDVDELRGKVSKRTRLIIINSPQNPTGSVLCRKDVEAIAEIALQNDAVVLSDEIYSRMVYSGEHVSIASFPGMKERTIILDGFSKTYAMTGWRLGYVVMPAELAAHIGRLMTNSNSCTSTFTQYAGLEALRGPQDRAQAMVAEFKERRDVVVEGLNQIPGIRCLKPEGAFYAFPNIAGTGMKSKPFADYLLEQAGVAVLSGTSFGKYGEGYIRISYANSLGNLRKALARIGDAVAALRRT